MNASVEVIVLVLVVAGATVVAFYLDVRRDLENGRFIEWLRTERAAAWNALSRSDRILTLRAVEILRRTALADDEEFHFRYRATRHGRGFAIAMSVAVAGIALLVAGTELFDWSW